MRELNMGYWQVDASSATDDRSVNIEEIDNLIRWEDDEMNNKHQSEGLLGNGEHGENQRFLLTHGDAIGVKMIVGI